jgi:tRNA(His) 5'-end guanylyltransferase
MKDFETLGDKLKTLEKVQTSIAADGSMPLMARLDGKGFSKFTKGLGRPFDSRMSSLMAETTKALVEQTSAKVGYTQSDEITLFWQADSSDDQYLFNGKYQKIVSTLSSIATAAFNRKLQSYLPEKMDFNPYPTFDARVWQVPSIREVYLNFLWREQDATKNAISMAAQSCYKHSELHKKSSDKKIMMLKDKGIAFEDYPAHFKRGVFVKRVEVEKAFTDDELQRIPENHRPAGPVLRTVVQVLNCDPIAKMKDPYQFLAK